MVLELGSHIQENEVADSGCDGKINKTERKREIERVE